MFNHVPDLRHKPYQKVLILYMLFLLLVHLPSLLKVLDIRLGHQQIPCKVFVDLIVSLS